MVVVSEFVGCSPSVSGAIRVNPWSIDSVADGIYTAIQMPAGDRHLRHEKHWRYISGHTVGYWAQVLDIALRSSTKAMQRLVINIQAYLCIKNSRSAGYSHVHF